MNSFFDIGKEGKPLNNEFQLMHLGKERVYLTTIPRRSSEFWGTSGQSKKDYFRPTTAGDYDQLFIEKLKKWRPVYTISKLLDYHYQYYITLNSLNDDFLMHIRYVIFPKLQPSYSTGPLGKLLEQWLDEHDPASKDQQQINMIHNHNINVGSINAPTQFQQNSRHSIQTQNNEIQKDTIEKLFELLRNDIQSMDAQIRKDFAMEMDYAVAQLAKEKDIKPQLLTIGNLISQIGIGMFSSLIASPIYDLIKLHLGIH